MNDLQIFALLILQSHNPELEKNGNLVGAFLWAAKLRN